MNQIIGMSKENIRLSILDAKVIQKLQIRNISVLYKISIKNKPI